MTGGGSAGHVYPALSIIRHLLAPRPATSEWSARAPLSKANLEAATETTVRVVYVGNSLGLERSLLPRAGVRAYLLPMAAPSTPRGVALLVLATVRSALVVARTRPDSSFATGGYVSIPAGIASWALRVPLVVFLPDVVPGRAVRLLVRMARRVAVSTEDSLRYLPAGKGVVTGYPVRDVFLTVSRAYGRRRFSLPEDARVLCVFGGSQGARAINEALAAALPSILAGWHVVHVCGEARLREAELAAAILPEALRHRYQLFPYLHDLDMAEALAAADLALCRSGASVLGELPATGTPAILVPLPERKVHQRENADYLANRGAAIVVSNHDLPARLTALLDELLAEPERLVGMRTACAALAKRDAAAAIARVIEGAV
jgi:UDP-N-acetylglucosamine--N-acetylmuramyl-(pentapeptide) pyrophosphoryl-undecaprenol N-acetylglucosamine transferase